MLTTWHTSRTKYKEAGVGKVAWKIIWCVVVTNILAAGTAVHMPGCELEPN